MFAGAAEEPPALDAAAKHFLSAHEKWRAHADADAKDKYLFGRNDLVRIAGLESKTEFNGLTGIVQDYLPCKDRFSVKCIGGQEDVCANIRPCNLSRVPSVPGSCLQAVIDAFFRPGMRYFGTIQIPGDAGYQDGAVIGKRQTYELTILGPAETFSPMGIEKEIQSVLGMLVLARHRAYDDEQFVFIRVTQGGGDGDPAADVTSLPLCMEYSDAETSCRGTWDPAAQSFVGSVSQKVHSTDQIFVKADPVTHTFDLYPCHHGGDEAAGHTSCTRVGSALSEVLCNHRCLTAAALEDCLNSFVKMASSVVNAQRLRRVHWAQLLAGTSLLVERTCAYIRLAASYLDALEFESPVSRRQKLCGLSERGVSRADVHSLCDESLRLVRMLLTWWYRIYPQQVTSTTALHVARYRLDKSYELFSEALKHASARLTDETLSSYALQAAVSMGEGSSDTCSICMDELCNGAAIGSGDSSGSEGLECKAPLVLPCSHAFHGNCIRSWLRFHAQCPMCRAGLAEVEREGEGGAADGQRPASPTHITPP